MQAPGVTLSADEVRDLFSAYHDRELSPERNEAVRAALAADPELDREYRAFCRMLDSLAAMAGDGPEPTVPAPTAAPAPDLLAGVQRRLHKRSGGRFYGDRWSRLAGLLPLEIIATLVLLALVIAYFGMTAVSPRPAPVPGPVPTAPR